MGNRSKTGNIDQFGTRPCSSVPTDALAHHNLFVFVLYPSLQIGLKFYWRRTTWGEGWGISTPKLSEWAHIIKGWPLLEEEYGKASKGERGVKGDWGRHAYSDTRERCLISCLNLPFPPLPNAPIIQRFPSLSWLAFQRKIQTKKLSARRCMASRQKSKQNAFNVAAFWPPENSLCSFFEDFEDKLFLYTKI